jgi:PTH1 family peptidyl-tRNA hydrolase
MENLYLIVGLGNPGSEYSRTRHNAGFLVVERLAERWQADWTYKKKFNAAVARVARGGKQVLLCRPHTYMNASGEAVRALRDYFDVPLTRLLVVVDDADLPFGQLRLRPGGSSGGHHGLESIAQQLGSREYPRLRLGIGRQDGRRDITDYVLGRFSSTELELVDTVLNAATNQVECWLDEGIQKAMSQFNGAAGGSAKEREEAQ